jgi:hypothetical protein
MRKVETFPVTLHKDTIKLIEETLPKGKVRASVLQNIVDSGMNEYLGNKSDKLTFDHIKFNKISLTEEGKNEIRAYYKRLNTFMRSVHMTGKSGFTKEVEGID